MSAALLSLKPTTLLRRAALTVAIALAGYAYAAPARAQDMAAAEELFREGRRLFEQGDYPTACAKLSESERLDASSGTLLNLAACHAKLGKTALAWAEFLATARLAKAQNKPERADVARQRAAELEPTLSYLSIVVSHPVPGLEVMRDDTLLEASSLGSRIPTDPGKHALSIRAPGYAPVTLSVTVGERADSQTVTVPALLPAAPDGGAPEATPPMAVEPSARPGESSGKSQPSAASPPATNNGKSQRTLGLAVGGVGALALAVGGVFGTLAVSAYHQADRECSSHRDCSTGALELADTAGSRATIANVSVGVGLVGIAAGAALILFAPRTVTRERTGQTSLRLAPVFAPQVTGVACSGAF